MSIRIMLKLLFYVEATISSLVLSVTCSICSVYNLQYGTCEFNNIKNAS